MAMAVKYYTSRKRYTGKHRVYESGQPIPETEIFGDKKAQLEGTKETTRGARKIASKNPILKVYVEKKGK